MQAWMDATFAVASESDMEVNEQADGALELAWTRPIAPSGLSALSVRMDRKMAADLRDRLIAVLSRAPAESAA